MRDAFVRHIAPCREKDWVVYAKQPFAGPEEVLKYVARYTHRVAISNDRLLNIDDGKVQFRWKDYRDDSRQKTMTLDADEFIRRFLLHVLPDGFQRIRYYGFLANRYRAEKLALCRQLMQMPPPAAAPEALGRRTASDLVWNARGVGCRFIGNDSCHLWCFDRSDRILDFRDHS